MQHRGSGGHVVHMPRWLHLGMSIKRWIVLLILGIVLLSLGAGYLLRALYSLDYRFPWWVRYLSLQFLSREARGILFFAGGAVLTLVALLRLSRTLIVALLPRRGARVIDILYQQRQLRRGPKVVAIGGGTGLSILLTGLKQYTGNLTGIVTVADDGGSSGRLRREMGILPPGDFRQCLAALADVEPLMAKLLHYRFHEGSGLEGHSLGNLMMAAMADISGSFELGLREMGRVLAIKGQILPSTLEDIVLIAQLRDKSYVFGESNLHEDHASVGDLPAGRSPIERVFVKPAHAGAYPEAVQAILDADLIVVGPGSLYTSILPNLLVEDILHAVSTSAAYKIFVCNVATEPGETDRYDMEDFLTTVERHVGEQLFDAMLINTRLDATRPPHWRSEVVASDVAAAADVRIIAADVVDDNNAVRHDPAKLARAIIRAWSAQPRQHARPPLKKAVPLA